jgi:hypothetical protein
MAFNYQKGSASRPIAAPPIESTTSAVNSIPSNAIGFIYTLCSAGGGGAAGGNTIGGGGGGAGEFIQGRVILAELTAHMGSSIANLSIESILGSIGSPGVGLNALGFGNAGESAGESLLVVRALGLVPSSIVLAVSRGGYGGLGGTQYQGWGHGNDGTTYTVSGGMGELVNRNEYRSRDGPDRRTKALNHYGDGGNGGAIGSPGLSGKPAYFSIEFF